MIQIAVDDQTGHRLNDAQIVSRLLFPADQDAAEAIEPGMASFDPSATWRRTCGVAWGQ
jgi:hypothetical protein